MATLSEHAATIQAAIEAARSDGCLLDWDFSYIEWWGETEVSTVNLALYRTKRGEDGVMRVDERARVLEADI